MQSRQFPFAEDVVSDEYIFDAAISHDFCLTHLLAGDAGRTGFDLLSREERKFVGLDVRSGRKTGFIQKVLSACDIEVDDPHVDQHGGSLKIGWRCHVDVPVLQLRSAAIGERLLVAV